MLDTNTLTKNKPRMLAWGAPVPADSIHAWGAKAMRLGDGGLAIVPEQSCWLEEKRDDANLSVFTDWVQSYIIPMIKRFARHQGPSFERSCHRISPLGLTTINVIAKDKAVHLGVALRGANAFIPVDFIDVPGLPADAVRWNLTRPDPEAEWFGQIIPSIGELVFVNNNGIGDSVVRGYFVQYGDLGLTVEPKRPPNHLLGNWRRLHKDELSGSDLVSVFGSTVITMPQAKPR